MARYSYSGNKKHKKKQNHASEYLPYLINELADEIEVVEQVLSGGEERQVLTANSNGKAQWAEGGGSGGGIEGIRVHENVVIVTGAGAPEINGLYIKIPNGEPTRYINSMRTIELVFDSDGYWFFHKFGGDENDDAYYYGADGTLDTPWAELVWEDWSGDFEQAPAPSPTIVSDTNYSGFAFFGDPVVADGEGGVKVIGNPNPLSREFACELKCDESGIVVDQIMINNTGANYTFEYLEPGKYNLLFDAPILGSDTIILCSSVITRYSSGGSGLAFAIAGRAGSSAVRIEVYPSLESSPTVDYWSNFRLDIRASA